MIIELPQIKMDVTHYILQQGRCRDCGQMVKEGGNDEEISLKESVTFVFKVVVCTYDAAQVSSSEQSIGISGFSFTIFFFLQA